MPQRSLSTENVSSGYAANMSGVAAVDRAMAIAMALEATKAPMTLSAIAQATGLYKSAILRLMVSLERCGLVVRRRDQSYMLGRLAFRLGKAYDSTNQLGEHLLPLMQDLVDRGFESPSFHLWQDSETRLCLLRIDSNHTTLDRVRAGDLLPMKKGAPGKVLESPQPPEPGTKVQDLIKVSLGERNPSCAAVAGPVYGPSSELLGALSLSGPVERFNKSSVAKMRAALLETCELATARVGGRWPELESASRRGQAQVSAAPQKRAA